jgi:hypothetical protein
MMTEQGDMFAAPTEPTGQCASVLRYMRGCGSITPRDAIGLGVYRLAARVLELRAMGYRIYTINERHEGGHHARYVLKTNEVTE